MGNGSGKTTSCRSFGAPGNGFRRAEAGLTVVFGCFEQTAAALNLHDAWLCRCGGIDRRDDARSDRGEHLERFLFDRICLHRSWRPVRRGVAAAAARPVVAGIPNFLLLVEPTNDLGHRDDRALEIWRIAKAASWPVPMIAHSGRSRDHFRLGGLGGIRRFPGTYSWWKAACEAEEETRPGDKTGQAPRDSPGRIPSAGRGLAAQTKAYLRRARVRSLCGNSRLESEKRELKPVRCRPRRASHVSGLTADIPSWIP